MTGAIESYDFPPAVTDAYKSGTAVAESYGVDPVYVGAGVAVAASGLLLLACGCCSAGPKTSKGSSGSKKKKGKAAKTKVTASTANGVPHKNGSGGGGRSGGAGGGIASGSGRSGVPGGSGTGVGKGGNAPAAAAGGPDKGAGSAKVVKPKKVEGKGGQQASGKAKAKGKAAKEAPPVITVRYVLRLFVLTGAFD